MSIYAQRFQRITVLLLTTIILYKAYNVASGKYHEINAKKLINPSEVVLSDLNTVQETSFRKLYGRITNNSPLYKVQSVALKIMYKDCQSEANAQKCQVIGEEPAVIMKSLLPGETTDFYTIISSSKQMSNKFVIVKYNIDYVEAFKASNDVGVIKTTM